MKSTFAELLPAPLTPISSLSPAQAAALLLRRRAARADLATWCELALEPFGQAPAHHHRLLIERLSALACGEIDRLMVLMPPGSAKSTYASVLFPAWFLARASRLNVIGASHTATLAEDFSRRVLATVAEHGAALGYDATRQAAELWSTTAGGAYKAVGIGGPVTGFRADLAIIDDPVKSRAEADSDRLRETTWNWFRADLITRLKPGGRIVLIQTRWHEDDLAGRLLETQPDRWHVLKLPALALDDDPLGRQPGEPLWPEWETAAQLTDKRRTLGERDWSALFQQDPRPGEGALFKVAMIPSLDAAPAGGTIVRAWDLAATEQVGTADPDWTAGVKLARVEDRYVVLDVVRVRGGPEQVEQAILNVASQDGHSVTIGLPQDPGQAGKAQVAYLTGKLAGYRVQSSPETGSKETRAASVASQVNVGNLATLRGNWTRPFIEELRDFPSGRKDDQVDALSRAFAMLTMGGAPTRRLSVPHMGR